MKRILKRELATRLPKPVVGCAVQGDLFLALSVSGSSEKWNVHWMHAGRLADEAKIETLAAKTGSSPFWTTPRKEGDAQRDVAFAVDIPDGVARSDHDRAEALRTQVETRFPNVADAIETGGADVRGPDGRHLVAFGAVSPKVDEDFRFWRRQCRIRQPHVAAPAAAIANLYLACCPPDIARDSADREISRLVVVQGRVTTTAVLMAGWRLLDAIEYQMLEGQTLDAPLVAGWIDFVRSHHPGESLDPQALADQTLVLSAETLPGFRTWNPFAPGGNVAAGRGVDLAALSGEMGFAATAFGMALQGGN